MTGSTLRTAANGLGLLVLVAAVLLAVLIAVPGLVGAEASYVVNSDSMSPEIQAGDLVVVSGTDASALSAGTVVTYRAAATSDTIITHRIVDVEETDAGTRYRTKGDANEEADPSLVAPTDVIGTLWFSVPLVGHLVAFANTKLGLLALVVVPAGALVASELYAFYADAYEAESDADEEGAL